MNFEEAVKTLRSGGVVAHATETCYGLAADIFSRSAVWRLYEMKKMSLDKPVSILVSSLEEAQKYGEFSEKAKQLAEKYWPGALTIVVPRKALIPEWINPGVSTIGIRVSSNEVTKNLVEAFGGPITTTSANIHGLPQAYCVEDFGSLKPDFILDSGKIQSIPPSTIVEVVGESVRVLREGGIKIG